MTKLQQTTFSDFLKLLLNREADSTVSHSPLDSCCSYGMELNL